MNKDINTPICVDLDGTLIYTDMLHESILGLLKKSPITVLKLPWLLLTEGKAKTKKIIAEKNNIEAALLPYNNELLNWLSRERLSGRRIILCTASDQAIAQPIAEHLGLFDEVIASDGVINLKGRNKGQVLINKFGNKGFDYAGNSAPDLEVWRYARRAIIVNAKNQLIVKTKKICKVEQIFKGVEEKKNMWMKAFRLHQWLKNILLFVPLLAAHKYYDVEALKTLIMAFIAFGLCASSVYLANDLLDLESDRQHPRKCKRPFASGVLPVWKGAFLSPLLFLLSCTLAYFMEEKFLQWLLIYFVITCIYSLRLKELVIVDCMTLAILYTLRIVAGAAAVGSAISFWLLAFSVFLFLSLAFIKRFAELQVQLLQSKHKVHGRGYLTDDAPLIQMLGIASGFMSVLVLALYLNSPEVLLLYEQPEWIWGLVPVMVFWISWLWLRAHRGEMHDDPLVFAVTDKASLVSGAMFAAFMLIGSAK